MSIQMSWWQLFLTTAGMIAVIDSILAGAFVGLLIYQLFASPLLPCLSAAIVIFLVVLVPHQRYQWLSWRRANRQLKVLFPSDAEAVIAMDRSQDLWVPRRTPNPELSKNRGDRI